AEGTAPRGAPCSPLCQIWHGPRAHPDDRSQCGDNSQVRGGLDQEMPPIAMPEGSGQCLCRAGRQSLLCVLWCPESTRAAQQRAELGMGEQVARGGCFRQGTCALQGLCISKRQTALLCSEPRGERGKHLAEVL
uniref:Uncharacterized protein n=1 Tax=Otus sunia TaxID=257818 RepID=A0A8C8ADJ6_9STRI